MQREREGRNHFFTMGDDISNFRGFGLMPSLFGGRDPFDDPFFTRPFGSMFEPYRFKSPSSATAEPSLPNKEKEVLIEELASDDGGKEDSQTGDEKNNSQENTIPSIEPSVEHPDDDPVEAERENKSVHHRKDYSRTGGTEPQARGFQTCKVTYGGIDGAYYTSTRTRRTGSDGVMIEENKEADKTTGQAMHRISRGIHDKGYSVTRQLKSDGKVDTMQTLHNLNEDELTGFEDAWKSNFDGQLLGWNNKFGSSSRKQNRTANWGGWAVPSIERFQNARVQGLGTEPRTNSTGAGTKKVVRINIE